VTAVFRDPLLHRIPAVVEALAQAPPPPVEFPPSTSAGIIQALHGIIPRRARPARQLAPGILTRLRREQERDSGADERADDDTGKQAARTAVRVIASHQVPPRSVLPKHHTARASAR
jgi:hypothetical protein